MKDILSLTVTELANQKVHKLSDIDFDLFLVSLRHIYLDIAKDLLKDERDFGEKLIGAACCDVAEQLQGALESLGWSGDSITMPGFFARERVKEAALNKNV